MPSLVTPPARAIHQPFTKALSDAIKDDLDYLVIAGADLAVLGGGNALTVTNEFHKVTVATGLVDTLTHAAPIKGQRVRLWFQNAQTIRNNGGGAGNIRTLAGGDRPVAANEVVAFAYDGALWRLVDPLLPISEPFNKTTSKTVNTTTADTDLLNGELTVAAAALGTNRRFVLRAWGDWLHNIAATSISAPRWKVKLGAAATLVLDSGVGTASLSPSATRQPWEIEVQIKNIGATGVQKVTFKLWLYYNVDDNSGWRSTFSTGRGRIVSLSGGADSTVLGYGANAGAIDTTAAMAVQLVVANPNAGAAYETKLEGAEGIIVG